MIPIFCVTSAFENHWSIIFSNTPLQLSPQMPPKSDPQVDKAAKLFVAAPNALKMTLPMVMRATGFLGGEAKDRSLHQGLC